LYKAKRAEKAAGCGASINWKECPVVPIEELQEMYKACPGLEDCVNDALKMMNQSSFSFSSRAERIDTSFH